MCVCASVLATVLMFYVWYYLVCMSVVLPSVYEFVLTIRLEAGCFKSWPLVNFFWLLMFVVAILCLFHADIYYHSLGTYTWGAKFHPSCKNVVRKLKPCAIPP